MIKHAWHTLVTLFATAWFNLRARRHERSGANEPFYDKVRRIL